MNIILLVIPGEHCGSNAREGDPGVEHALDVDTWVPFPSLRSAGNDKTFLSAPFHESFPI
jgi:hypothetical protein